MGNRSMEIEKQREKIVKGLEIAYERLIEFKKGKNSPVVVSRNGKVIEESVDRVPAKVKYKWR